MTFNLADLFESIVDAIPDREAVVCGDRRLTFAMFDERANRLANHFRAQGIGPGDHVGLYLYNRTEYLEAVLAAFKLRAVPININYRYVEAELAYLCDNAKLKALLYEPDLRERLSAVEKSETIKWRLAVGEEYDRALEKASPERNLAPRSGDDLYIIYTGGTTGMPRGVMWRQEDVFFRGLQGGNPGGEPLQHPEELAQLAKAGDRALIFLPAAPFIHGAAQWAAFIGLFSGGKVVIAPGPRFEPERIWQLIADEKVTTLTLVGDAMARPLADTLEGKTVDVSSLFVISSAGAILSASVKSKLDTLLPNVMVLNSFGSSEAGHHGTALPGSDRLRFYMDDTSVVLDENLQPIEPGSGKIGKLARRGRVPVGYFNDPEKTAATFVTIDGVRHALPGDLATVEADGQIAVLGRGAVCINSGGEKIFPEEVEEALKSHPAILDAVVVGIPDERWGERVVALVQPRPGQILTLDDICAHCRTLVAGYKVPKQLRIVDEIARQPSGKPDYRWAKATALANVS